MNPAEPGGKFRDGSGKASAILGLHPQYACVGLRGAPKDSKPEPDPLSLSQEDGQR